MAAKKGSTDAKNVVCPTCWRRGTRSPLDASPANVAKLAAGDRFPGPMQVPDVVYVCPTCRGCWEE